MNVARTKELLNLQTTLSASKSEVTSKLTVTTAKVLKLENIESVNGRHLSTEQVKELEGLKETQAELLLKKTLLNEQLHEAEQELKTVSALPLATVISGSMKRKQVVVKLPVAGNRLVSYTLHAIYNRNKNVWTVLHPLTGKETEIAINGQETSE